MCGGYEAHPVCSAEYAKIFFICNIPQNKHSQKCIYLDTFLFYIKTLLAERSRVFSHTDNLICSLLFLSHTTTFL